MAKVTPDILSYQPTHQDSSNQIEDDVLEIKKKLNLTTGIGTPAGSTAIADFLKEFERKNESNDDGNDDCTQQKPGHVTNTHQSFSKLYYGFGDITKPVGVLVKRPVFNYCYKDTLQDNTQDYTHIGDLIKDKKVLVKVRPILVSFSGLPESGKSTALQSFLDNHVKKCPKKPITDKATKPGDGITQYELIADGTNPDVNFTLSEAMKESYFAFGLLSAFKNILALDQGKPILDVTIGTRYFKNDSELENCLMNLHRCLCNEPSIPKNTSHSEEKAAAALGLEHSFPECLALINIWDHSISNVVRHLLSALQGHLYNHHMFLFLDLERDLEHLDKPPKITKAGTDGAMFMKWRPRLHYLLRSAWATEKKGEKKVQTCTLFAKSDRPYSKRLKKEVQVLADLVNPVAKHIGVAKLLEKKVEVVNVQSDHKRIYRKIQRIAVDEPMKEIPLSWVFLRSSFLFSDKVFISQQKLKEKAIECGMDKRSLSKFCHFYTSFGSIIDLSLTDPQCELVLIKPIEFLKKLGEFIYPKDDTFARYPNMKLGIVREDVCVKVFEDLNWVNVMAALESLNLATRISRELPDKYFLHNQKNYYYIPLCCKGDPVTEVDSNSVHLITGIDTPHFFKQVTIVKHLLVSLRALQPKLVPCNNINQTIIKTTTTDTTVTFSFHSPVIRIHLDKPDSTVLSHVVNAFNNIAYNAYENGEIKVKYKFVRMCAKKEIPNVQSLLSSFYHVLPYDGHCETCTAAGRNDELLKVWNEVLQENQVPEELKPTGLIKSSEMMQIAEKITNYCNKSNVDLNEIVRDFVPDYKTCPQFEKLTNEKLLNDILDYWQNDLSQKRNDGLEPRRLLAEKLSELGGAIYERSGEYYIKEKFDKLAQSIDVYWHSPNPFPSYNALTGDENQRIKKLKAQLSEERKQLQEKEEELQETTCVVMRLTQFSKSLTNDDILKLAVILQPVEKDWYSLGEALNVNKTLLDEIKEKGEGLESLLQVWCMEGKKTLTQLEEGLKMIGKKKLIPGLFHMNIPLRDGDVLIAEKNFLHFKEKVPNLKIGNRMG